ncbi:HAD hydrolase-like protein [Pseudodesulfovibrio sp.]|uniref:HAD family hydrolase n=1 Tax=Pseudodesulfovibrio sp. TaxID=2035812 RepID=UPI00262C6EC5|nr:HAD hydrolase-like protein [Pseudodesulfovibrio sp.]MDD3310858.1 HAD hydrolase-like protein [Pseudodesulfovibrio sp.]
MAIANPLMNPRLVEGVRAVVFDCDGVLIDSYESNMRYYGEIKERLGLPPLTEEEKLYVHSRTHVEALRYIAPTDELYARTWEIVRSFDPTMFNPYLKRSEGIREFLDWLRSAGFAMAVNTSRSLMDPILRIMDLEGFFRPVITTNLTTRPKPSPEGLFRIMEELRVAPQEVAYIGDTHVDEKAAIGAGVRFWAHRAPTLRAEVHINSFWDLRAVMQRCYKERGRVF